MREMMQQPDFASQNTDRSLEAQPQEFRAGQVCPFCGQGIVDYDGMLNLVCPVCGKQEGGCFT